MIRLLVLLVALVACSSSSAYPSAGSGSEAGTEAPDVALRDHTGETWRLADALSRHARVMLVFYRGDWCPYCRKQLGELQSTLPELARRDVEIVGISVDDVATNRALVERLALRYPLLSDADRAVMRAYGVEAGEIARPAIFVVGRDRKVAWRWLSDSYKQRIPAADVVRALDALTK